MSKLIPLKQLYRSELKLSGSAESTVFHIESGKTQFDGNVFVTGIGDLLDFSTSINGQLADIGQGNAGIFNQISGSLYSTENDLEVTGSIKTNGLHVSASAATENNFFSVIGKELSFDFDEFDYIGIFKVSGESTFSGSLAVEGIGNLKQQIDNINDDIINKQDIISITDTDTSFTLNSSNGTFIECNNAVDIDITIPHNDNVVIEVPHKVTIWRNGIGDINIIADNDVTINGNVIFNGQYSSITLIKVSLNRWNSI